AREGAAEVHGRRDGSDRARGPQAGDGRPGTPGHPRGRHARRDVRPPVDPGADRMRHHPRRDPRHRTPHSRHRAQGGERLSGPGRALAVPTGPEPALGDDSLAPPPAAALPAGTLFVVATPIGNLEDITLRALRVLREVDLVAAEDTRRTRALLEAHGVHAPLISYFEHNQARRAPELLRRLQGGARVALVTDAGTPGVSDPGFRLVRLCRDAGIPVVPVPGASALVAALSAAGIPADRFVFEGLLPGQPGRA